MSKVVLEYSFIFDPAETWQSATAFDSSLAMIFSKLGLKAELVEDKANLGRKMIIINKDTENSREYQEPKENSKKKDT